MAIPIDDLIDPLKGAVNPPGTDMVSANDEAWATALRGAFWEAKVFGYFNEYRIDPTNDSITPVPPLTEDLPGELQQLVVMYAALTVFENYMTSLDTTFRAKSGEQEFETQKTASLLIEVLKGRRAQLATLRDELIESATGSTFVGVVDMVALRLGEVSTGAQQWVGS